MVYIVEEICDFDKQDQNREGQGLKTLTRDQILSTSPINLA